MILQYNKEIFNKYKKIDLDTLIQIESIYEIINTVKDDDMLLKNLIKGLSINPFDGNLRLEYVKQSSSNLENSLLDLINQELMLLQEIHNITIDNSVGEFYLISETRPYMRMLFELAYLYSKNGNTNKVISIYKQMLELDDSDNMGIRYNLVNYLIENEKYNQALRFYEDEYPFYNTSMDENGNEYTMLSEEAYFHLLCIYAYYKKPMKFKEVIDAFSIRYFIDIKNDIYFKYSNSLSKEQFKLIHDYINTKQISYGDLIWANQSISSLELLEINYIIELLKFNNIDISKSLELNTRSDIKDILMDGLVQLINTYDKSEQHNLLLYFLDSCISKFGLNIKTGKILSDVFLEITNIDLYRLVMQDIPLVKNTKEILKLPFEILEDALILIKDFKLLPLESDDILINAIYIDIISSIDEVCKNQPDSEVLDTTLNFIMSDLEKTKELLLNRKLLKV